MTQNTASANLTLGDQYINDAIRRICTAEHWDFMEDSTTATTTASTQAYNLPYNYDKMIAVTITVSSTVHTAKEITSRDEWNRLNMVSQTSDIVQYFFISDGQINFFPTPASSSNTITYYYQIRVRDLGSADYSTGSIVSIANGAAAVVGTGTSWTSQMIGRWIRITRTDAVTSGDGEWYQISAVGSATTLTLARNYAGTTLAAATASYVIGEMPVIPEPYQILPVQEAAVWYWAQSGNEKKAKSLKDLFDEGYRNMKKDHLNKTTSYVVDSGEPRGYINPNLLIKL